MKLEKTNTTQKEYSKRFNYLNRIYEEQSGNDWSHNPKLFVEWCFNYALEKKWAKTTWRVYRAALTNHFKMNGPLEAISILNSLGSVPKWKNAPKRTSSQKQKMQPQNDLTKLLKWLKIKNQKYDRLLALWLVAGRITGLRPIEWDSAVLDNKILTVKNAKATNGRGLGAHRQILLTNSPDKEVQVVRGFLQLYSEFKTNLGGHVQTYEGVRKRLLRANKSLFPKRQKKITLYSARHELSRRMKGAQMRPSEIAAILGHKTTETMARNYARKPRIETIAPTIKAPESKIQTVIVKDKKYQPKQTPTKN